MRPGRRSAWAVALAALLLASLGMAAPAAASGPHVKVIASGLDNPRGLTIDRHGRVLVALAGQGGAGRIRHQRQDHPHLEGRRSRLPRRPAVGHLA